MCQKPSFVIPSLTDSNGQLAASHQKSIQEELRKIKHHLTNDCCMTAMRAKAEVRCSGIMFNLSINFYGSFTAMSRHCRNLV
jgi:hypothetical protein